MKVKMFFAIVSAVVFLSGCAGVKVRPELLTEAPSKEAVIGIDIEEAKALYDSGEAVFVDARAEGEFNEGHIAGAVSVPVGTLDAKLESIKDKIEGKVLVTYCHGIGCHLADKDAHALYDKGYKKVLIFFGGWPKWTAHGYPVEKTNQ